MTTYNLHDEDRGEQSQRGQERKHIQATNEATRMEMSEGPRRQEEGKHILPSDNTPRTEVRKGPRGQSKSTYSLARTQHGGR